MAKLESTLKNMILSLAVISMVMSAALGVVYNLTKGPIEKADKQKEIDAIKGVLPAFDNDPTKEMKEVDGITFYPAKKGNQLVGYAVKTFTEKGFAGHIGMMVGILPDGTIHNTIVLQQKETPGLGTKMMEPKFHDQFNGKNPASFNMTVKKDGGEVDAITAATISSRAYCDALDRAFKAFNKEFATSKVESAADKCDTITCKITDFALFAKVLPKFDNKPETTVKQMDNCEIFTATMVGKTVGYAIKSGATGYNTENKIWILTGFDIDGTIVDVIVLSQKESVGYGDQILDKKFLSQFKGKKPETFKLDLKSNKGSIDGISGATISSKGFADALLKAYEIFKQVKQ
jgi:Na+-translocating ferredoxin:NAD+ oxidoreductase subunit G